MIIAALPFVAGLGAWAFQGEKMTRSIFVASCAAFAGVTVMLGSGAGDGSFWGDILALALTLAIAALTLLARHFRDVLLLPAAALSALLSAIPAIPFAQILSANFDDVFGPAIFGLTNLGISFALFVLGSRLLPAAETGLIAALDAPLAPIWVWLLPSETPARATVVGGMIVLVAVAANLFANWQSGQNAVS